MHHHMPRQPHVCHFSETYICLSILMMTLPKHQLQRSVGVPQGRTASKGYELALRELCDHLAEELAKEYISLMKETASKPGKREE